jgi:hypothetical protein
MSFYLVSPIPGCPYISPGSPRVSTISSCISQSSCFSRSLSCHFLSRPWILLYLLVSPLDFFYLGSAVSSPDVLARISLYLLVSCPNLTVSSPDLSESLCISCKFLIPISQNRPISLSDLLFSLQRSPCMFPKFSYFFPRFRSVLCFL